MTRPLPPTAHEEVASRAWVVSDLQTSSPAESRRVLTTAIGDIRGLVSTLDQLWYLGDAVSGSDPEPNREVAAVQMELLNELGVPSRYVMGNHDIDPPRKAGVFEMPFYERARDDPNWRTTASPDDFYFVDELGGHSVLFLSDHVSPDIESYHTYSPERAFRARLSDGSTERRFADQNQNRQVIEVMAFLGEEQGLFERIDPPYEDEASGLCINTAPERADGSEMRNPVGLSNGWYFDRSLEKRSARAAIETVADMAGFEVAFDGLWATGGE